MVSLTRREFEAAAAEMTEAWLDARRATLARRLRRQDMLSDLERDPAAAAGVRPILTMH